MRDILMIMNFKNEKLGYVERTKDKFITVLGESVEETFTLPKIMQGIAPEPTQFPSVNDGLEYYEMKKMDVWEFFKKSNGLKSSRDIWFMTEPPGEVWIPLIIGMQPRHMSYNSYRALFGIGDNLRILMNGKAFINRHTVDIFPPHIKDYLVSHEGTRFSTATGRIKDLVEYPSVKGIIGRVVINIPKL